MKKQEYIVIRRQQILSYLLLVAFVAGMVTACSEESDISDVREIPPNDAIADQPTDAVFYETADQCRQDVTQKIAEYQVQQAEFQQEKTTTPPVEPTMRPEDCEAQLALALREHEASAPVYQTLEQCQTEGTECTQATENGGTTSVQGYSPRFGGTFIYPYDPTPDFVYFYYGGINHRVYRPSTVYRSTNAGSLITPYGRTVPHYRPGQKVSVPQHTRFTAPARPSGKAASGVIRGRSSRGFGSTYKSTGRGGIGK